MALPLNIEDVLLGRSISLENLKTGHLVARRYRNRRIGEFLKEMRLTEGRGTGIPTVLRAMKENGSPLPLFDTDENRSYFSVTLPVHSIVTPQVAIQAESERGRNEKMRDLLEFCTSPRDRASIQARLNIQDRQHLRERYLAPAIAADWLTMTEPAHPNSPKQKYRTTPQGTASLGAVPHTASGDGPEQST